MMKNYMTTKNLARNKKPEGDSAGKEATPFPEEKVVMLIYGGQAPHKSRPKLKQTGRRYTPLAWQFQSTCAGLNLCSVSIGWTTQI
jgi:hypothetical protein